jgi:hypothetical protein
MSGQTKSNPAAAQIRVIEHDRGPVVQALPLTVMPGVHFGKFFKGA